MSERLDHFEGAVSILRRIRTRITHPLCLLGRPGYFDEATNLALLTAEYFVNPGKYKSQLEEMLTALRNKHNKVPESAIFGRSVSEAVSSMTLDLSDVRAGNIPNPLLVRIKKASHDRSATIFVSPLSTDYLEAVILWHLAGFPCEVSPAAVSARRLFASTYFSRSNFSDKSVAHLWLDGHRTGTTERALVTALHEKHPSLKIYSK